MEVDLGLAPVQHGRASGFDIKASPLRFGDSERIRTPRVLTREYGLAVEFRSSLTSDFDRVHVSDRQLAGALVQASARLPLLGAARSSPGQAPQV